MLGKMLKHEWKGTSGFGFLMLLLIVGVTFFGWLAFQTPMWQAMVESGSSYGSSSPFSILDVLSLMTLFLYVVMLIGVSYGTIIYLGVRFYKTMYTEEGYLTHTLPVKKSTLLGSKIFVSGCWYMIIEIAVVLSVFALISSMIFAVIPPTDLQELIEALRENWDVLIEAVSEVLGLDFALWGVLIIISTIIAPFCSIAILFGAISLGQLFTKHRVLGAIVCYIGFLVVNMLISTVVQNVTGANLMQGLMAETAVIGGFINTSAIVSTVQSLVIAAVMTVASYMVINKKLNLE